GKDETYFAVIHKKGETTAELLKIIVEKTLNSFTWAKSMRWGSGQVRWVRPLHSILCILDGKIIPIEFAGIKASNITYGHRFLAPEAIIIQNVDEYETKLEAAKVIVDNVKRKEIIKQQAIKIAAENNLEFRNDNGLLDEVTGLVEYPNVLLGRIDEKFMDLPPEVLISEMRAHQKYFALTDAKGNISSKFLITANITTLDNGKAIIAGNERVLRARLSDGRFFFDQDRKKSLAAWAEGLKNVTFHAKIGTIAEKVERIEKLALAIAENVPNADENLVAEAAKLCKADLLTGMVGEFPELQGVMGRYYAINEDRNPLVADAIREHYLPLGDESPIPTNPISICIALADKLDSLIQMFAIGEKPTGSKDPFALRRAALGIIRIILENNLRIDLNKFLDGELFSFFISRLIVLLRDQNIRPDVIKAVIATQDYDLLRIKKRAEALQNFLITDDGANLIAAYKRANNIVLAAEKKGDLLKNLNSEGLALNEYDINLANAFNLLEENFAKEMDKENFTAAIHLAAKLRSPVDDFLNNVMINVEDEKLRAYRLNLLAKLKQQLDFIADFSLLEL
ncbi:MAG: glycine--tRNA ligase subunit beta, partial [Pseudomonadota bacterium]